MFERKRPINDFLEFFQRFYSILVPRLCGRYSCANLLQKEPFLWRFHFFAIIHLLLQNDGGCWQEINFDNVPHVLSAIRMSVTVRDDVFANDSESVLFSLWREYFWMCEHLVTVAPALTGILFINGKNFL